jgi:hypothetical protein
LKSGRTRAREYTFMRIIKLSTTILGISLFLLACNQNQPQQTATAEPYPNDAALNEAVDDEYWAKDNLDLERVGNLIERADSPEEFESYLNDDDGINNLDLNGDGYVDYISVDEFEDRDSNTRGLSLFSRFGPDLIQEIATLFLYRDRPDYPGARILLRGNEQLYGDNSYYETNWLDRSVPFVSTLFSDRDSYYHSPYYYDNYPAGYQIYEVVETPVYRTRIAQLYPQPVIVYTTAPTFIDKVKIKSPHNGKWMDKVYAKLAKPTKEQAEFKKNNPGRPHIAKADKIEKGAKKNDGLDGDIKPGRVDPPRSDRGDERGNPPKAERGPERGNPNKPAGGNPNKGGGPPKADNPNKGGDNPNKGGGNPNKGGGKGGGKKP